MIQSPLTASPMNLIISVLEEYTDWYSQVVRRVFYPDSDNMMTPIASPKSFAAWRTFCLSNQSLDIGELDRITQLHKELHTLADKIVTDSAASGARPDEDQYSEFANMLDGFLHRLRRVEADHYLSGRGYDAVTGLRTQQVMMIDLAREMERVARHGRAFSLVASRIENIDDLKIQLADDFGQMMTWLGQGILATIRTFDDAYRYNDTQFLMSLKHADIQGALRFVDRLRTHFESKPLVIKGQQIQARMTFVVAEPLGEENLAELLHDLQQDLVRASGGNDAVVRYEEASPLQRFVKESSGV